MATSPNLKWAWRRPWEHPLLGQTLPRVLAPIILALLAAVAAYFGWWRGPEVDLVGELQYGVHAWPPEVTQMLHVQSLTNFLKPPPKSELPAPSSPTPRPFDPADLYAEVFDYRMINSVWFVTIVNRGSLPASGVCLRMPEGTLLWSSRKEAETPVSLKKNDRVVDVGNLSPGQRALVVAWGAMGISEAAAQQIMLSHQGGAGRLTIRGPAGPTARFIESYSRALLAAAVTLLLAVSYASFRFGKRRSNTEMPNEPASAAAKNKPGRKRRR